MDPLEVPVLDTTKDEILLAATNHDLAKLKPFLRTPGAASVQDPDTLYTPLHAAISACRPDPEGEIVDLEAGKSVVQELFLSGAIWNDVDALHDETPGCLAWRLGLKELYELCVEAGVRAEMLMNLMGGYEELGSEGDGEDEGQTSVEADTENGADEEATTTAPEDNAAGSDNAEAAALNEEHAEPSPKKAKKDVNSADYLASELKFTDSTLLDGDANGVMMDWETPIMEKTAELICSRPGLRVLNIGYGMGIIDTLFANTKPSVHHIIEAHPDVLAELSKPSCPFGPKWQASETASNAIHPGKWQDVVPQLLEEGQQYDVIYFDTFGESYSQLRMFFTEYVVALLSEEGKFSFFNGLGADRRVCYDVYCRVAELDLCDAGFDVAWTDVEVKELGGEGEGEWKGVRRRYWVLDTYRLPVATFMG